MAAPIQLTRMHRVLIGVVVTGAVIIAGIGFAGSYAAVRELAIKKGFGNFSYVFPIGIDAGICVLLALDLLLTWIRIPFPLLRQTAWLLTAATIAFNGAAAWPDPLGVGMHAVIPVLFVVAVEAARHAIGRIADITADKHMEGVRITRWLLSPAADVPAVAPDEAVGAALLRPGHQAGAGTSGLPGQAALPLRPGVAPQGSGRALMPLRLARYGVPLAETAPAGLAAAGIEPALLPPVPLQAQAQDRSQGTALAPHQELQELAAAPVQRQPQQPEPRQGGQVQQGPQGQGMQGQGTRSAQQAQPDTAGRAAAHAPEDDQNPWFQSPHEVQYQGGYDPTYDPSEQYAQWYEEQQRAEQYADQYQEEPPAQEPSPEETGSFPIPVVPGRSRELGEGGGSPEPTEDDYYLVFKKSIDGSYPTSGQLRNDVEATYGVMLPQREADRMVNRFTNRHTAELQDDHIA